MRKSYEEILINEFRRNWNSLIKNKIRRLIELISNLKKKPDKIDWSKSKVLYEFRRNCLKIRLIKKKKDWSKKLIKRNRILRK